MKEVAIGSASTDDNEQYYQIEAVLADEHQDQDMENKVKLSHDDPVLTQLPGVPGAKPRTVFRDKTLVPAA